MSHGNAEATDIDASRDFINTNYLILRCNMAADTPNKLIELIEGNVKRNNGC